MKRVLLCLLLSLGLVWTNPTKWEESKRQRIEPSTKVPESIDWRNYGVVTPVEDQSSCNTCWAFATTATLEAHLNIYGGPKNTILSTGNLADCVYSNFTCSQLMATSALRDSFQYVRENGIDSLETYPYDARLHECHYNSSNVVMQIKDYVMLPEGDEEQLKIAVGTIGPVSVIITTDIMFDLYHTGVYYSENCMNTPEPYNHAVSVVGYGTEDGEDYWLVKNSWGIWFGEQGYIKMARNRDNNCGIATYAVYPILV